MQHELEQHVRWLRDHEQIRQLVNRYAVGVDSRDTAGVAALFTPDAFTAIGLEGRDAIARHFDELLRNAPVSILNVGTHVVDLELGADTASGTVYCRGEIEAGTEWIVQQIVYRDRYVRHAGSWVFGAREHLLFYGADLLERPIGLAPAGHPETWRGKGSMPQRWPSYRQFLERTGQAHDDATS